MPADAVSPGQGSSSAGGKEGECTAATLHSLYQHLLALVLEDAREHEVASAQEKRWGAVLSEGTWPEVLRRLVLTRTRAVEEEELPWRWVCGQRLAGG